MFDKKVKSIFNEMNEEYDQINDLWYSWLFSRLHFLIASKVTLNWTSKKEVLDIGCGTGFQSLLYSLWGANVTGIDISEKLLEKASEKIESLDSSQPQNLFEPKFGFVEKYNKKIKRIYDQRLNPLQYIAPKFMLGDAQKLDFSNESFDHINCCGSTLSFISNYIKAIDEISRCLKPNGTFVLEVESKNNMDLLWTILDASVLRGKLEYETSFGDAYNQIFKKIGKHIDVEYPFGDSRNPIYMNITLFKKSKLISELKEANLKVDSSFTINSFTNLIPSTILDTKNPSYILRNTFSLLSTIEEKLPFNLPGCSLVLFGTKSS